MHVSLELASLIKQCVYLLSPAIAACNSNVKYLFTSVFEAALTDLWSLGGQEKTAKQAKKKKHHISLAYEVVIVYELANN